MTSGSNDTSPLLWRIAVNLVLAAIAIAIPIVWMIPSAARPTKLEPAFESAFPPSDLPLFPSRIGAAPTGKPLVTNVAIVDLDRDGRPDVLVCDAAANRVIWYQQMPDSGWEEHALGTMLLAAPCHADVADLDGDGDLDILVAVLGSVYPADEPIGKVVILENDGRMNFTTRVVLDGLRRVADARIGDLNGDGKPDLVVAEFGYDQGRLIWVENRGGGRFRDRELLALPGASHSPLADFDGDGDLDIGVLVSQDDEEVFAFENLGGGTFRRRTIFASPNFDLGGSGLLASDLNRDGRTDLLLIAGDNLEVTHPVPQPWHGAYILENRGEWNFSVRRVAAVPGVYGAAVADLDADGEADLVLGCMFNDWRTSGTASLVWLRGLGAGQFAPPRQIADTPSHVATVAAADLDGDGRADIVAGSLHIQAPFDRLGRVTLWSSRSRRVP